MVAPQSLHFAQSVRGIQELASLGPHDLHRAMVPCDILSIDPHDRSLAKGTSPDGVPGVWELTCPRPHGLHGAMMPLWHPQLRPPNQGPTTGTSPGWHYYHRTRLLYSGCHALGSCDPIVVETSVCIERS
jgi:hypothetical protein